MTCSQGMGHVLESANHYPRADNAAKQATSHCPPSKGPDSEELDSEVNFTRTKLLMLKQTTGVYLQIHRYNQIQSQYHLVKLMFYLNKTK